MNGSMLARALSTWARNSAACHGSSGPSSAFAVILVPNNMVPPRRYITVVVYLL
jgi:hypothetical protein